MNQINQTEFLLIAMGAEDGVVIISTTTCAKCASLKKRVDDEGNPHGIVNYVFDPDDSEAADFLGEAGYLSVPVTLRSLDGVVEASSGIEPDEVYEELGLT